MTATTVSPFLVADRADLLHMSNTTSSSSTTLAAALEIKDPTQRFAALCRTYLLPFRPHGAGAPCSHAPVPPSVFPPAPHMSSKTSLHPSSSSLFIPAGVGIMNASLARTKPKPMTSLMGEETCCRHNGDTSVSQSGGGPGSSPSGGGGQGRRGGRSHVGFQQGNHSTLYHSPFPSSSSSLTLRTDTGSAMTNSFWTEADKGANISATPSANNGMTTDATASTMDGEVLLDYPTALQTVLPHLQHALQDGADVNQDLLSDGGLMDDFPILHFLIKLPCVEAVQLCMAHSRVPLDFTAADPWDGRTALHLLFHCLLLPPSSTVGLPQSPHHSRLASPSSTHWNVMKPLAAVPVQGGDTLEARQLAVIEMIKSMVVRLEQQKVHCIPQFGGIVGEGSRQPSVHQHTLDSPFLRHSSLTSTPLPVSPLTLDSAPQHHEHAVAEFMRSASSLHTLSASFDGSPTTAPTSRSVAPVRQWTDEAICDEDAFDFLQQDKAGMDFFSYAANHQLLSVVWPLVKPVFIASLESNLALGASSRSTSTGGGKDRRQKKSSKSPTTHRGPARTAAPRVSRSNSLLLASPSFSFQGSMSGSFLGREEPARRASDSDKDAPEAACASSPIMVRCLPLRRRVWQWDWEQLPLADRSAALLQSSTPLALQVHVYFTAQQCEEFVPAKNRATGQLAYYCAQARGSAWVASQVSTSSCAAFVSAIPTAGTLTEFGGTGTVCLTPSLSNSSGAILINLAESSNTISGLNTNSTTANKPVWVTSRMLAPSLLGFTAPAPPSSSTSWHVSLGSPHSCLSNTTPCSSPNAFRKTQPQQQPTPHRKISTSVIVSGVNPHHNSNTTTTANNHTAVAVESESPSSVCTVSESFPSLTLECLAQLLVGGNMGRIHLGTSLHTPPPPHHCQSNPPSTPRYPTSRRSSCSSAASPQGKAVVQKEAADIFFRGAGLSEPFICTLIKEGNVDYVRLCFRLHPHPIHFTAKPRAREPLDNEQDQPQPQSCYSVPLQEIAARVPGRAQPPQQHETDAEGRNLLACLCSLLEPSPPSSHSASSGFCSPNAIDVGAAVSSLTPPDRTQTAHPKTSVSMRSALDLEDPRLETYASGSVQISQEVLPFGIFSPQPQRAPLHQRRSIMSSASTAGDLTVESLEEVCLEAISSGEGPTGSLRRHSRGSSGGRYHPNHTTKPSLSLPPTEVTDGSFITRNGAGLSAGVRRNRADKLRHSGSNKRFLQQQQQQQRVATFVAMLHVFLERIYGPQPSSSAATIHNSTNNSVTLSASSQDPSSSRPPHNTPLSQMFLPHQDQATAVTTSFCEKSLHLHFNAADTPHSNMKTVNSTGAATPPSPSAAKPRRDRIEWGQSLHLPTTSPLAMGESGSGATKGEEFDFLSLVARAGVLSAVWPLLQAWRVPYFMPRGGAEVQNEKSVNPDSEVESTSCFAKDNILDDDVSGGDKARRNTKRHQKKDGRAARTKVQRSVEDLEYRLEVSHSPDSSNVPRCPAQPRGEGAAPYRRRAPPVTARPLPPVKPFGLSFRGSKDTITHDTEEEEQQGIDSDEWCFSSNSLDSSLRESKGTESPQRHSMRREQHCSHHLPSARVEEFECSQDLLDDVDDTGKAEAEVPVGWPLLLRGGVVEADWDKLRVEDQMAFALAF